jgi:Purple acid Phosphatase, N-terminal domain
MQLFITTLLSVLLTLACNVASTRPNPRVCGGNVRHVHIAVGTEDASTSMTVSFASTYSFMGPPLVGGVSIGTTPFNLDRVVIENDFEINDSDHAHASADSPGFYNVTVENGANDQLNMGKYYSPYYHHVTITGLTPNTTYYYRPALHSKRSAFFTDSSSGSDEAGIVETEVDVDSLRPGRRRVLVERGPYDGSSIACPSPTKIRSFKTAPVYVPASSDGKVSASGERVNLVFMGDLGQFPHSEETVARMLRSMRSVDSVVLAGDLGYTSENHLHWDTFMDFLDDFPIAAHIPVSLSMCFVAKLFGPPPLFQFRPFRCTLYRGTTTLTRLPMINNSSWRTSIDFECRDYGHQFWARTRVQKDD